MTGVSTLMRSRRLGAVLAVILALLVAACGSSSSSAGNASGAPAHGSVRAIAGFAVHAGVAFGVFHHFVYEPFAEHKLGLTHPIKDGEAAAAALFAYHELGVARSELNGHPHLERLVGPVTLLYAAMRVLRSHVARGDTSGISGVQSQVGSVSRQSSHLGSPITESTSGFHF